MSMPFAFPRVAVVGAGLTGLAAAHALKKAGAEVTVFEASARAGGVVETAEEEGFLHERGPNTLLETAAEVTALIDELGLGSQRLAACPAARHRYVVRRGRLVPLPLSPPALLASSLFSPGAKLRLLSEFFRRPRPRASDVSVADFFAEHFGREAVTYAVDPMVSGIYAGDPERLDARRAFPRLWEVEQKFGSLLRGQIALARQRRRAGLPRPGILSFRRGLRQLPEALAAGLGTSLRLKSPVRAIVREDGRWRLGGVEGNLAPGKTFDRVFLAVEPAALARLEIGAASVRPLAGWETLERASVVTLALGFRREAFLHPLDGFGFLAPSVEKRRLLGAIFASTLFPDRAPPGHVLLSAFVGGVRHPERVEASDDELVAMARSECAALLGLREAPTFVRIARWRNAIPQYDARYARELSPTVDRVERENPGLFVAGQAREGISLGDCLLSGLRTAGRALEQARF